MRASRSPPSRLDDGDPSGLGNGANLASDSCKLAAVEYALLIFVGVVVAAGLVVYLGPNEAKREAQAVRNFAQILQDGFVEGAASGQRTMGRQATGRCAMGKWNGVEVAVGLFGRFDPPGTITRVSALRKSSPFAARLSPRSDVSPANSQPLPNDALRRAYEVGFAPEGALDVVMDEATVNVLAALENCEVEVHGTQVNIQYLGVLFDATKLVPLLDATIHLVKRMDAVHPRIVGANEEESARRASEVRKFTNPRRRAAG